MVRRQLISFGFGSSGEYFSLSWTHSEGHLLRIRSNRPSIPKVGNSMSIMCKAERRGGNDALITRATSFSLGSAKFDRVR
jgi:hypothetical protein